MKMTMRFFTMIFAASIIFTGCKNEEKTPKQMIAGENSKTWEAKRENGDRIDKADRDEEMTFYANGKFSMQSDENTMSGTWKHTGDQLSLVFEGAANSENFNVKELSDSKMRLIAGDGSEMLLKADD